MATLVIDTYQFVKGLTKAGISAGQAEAIADGLSKVNLEHVATKQDLAELKADIFKWAVPLLIGQIAVFVIVVKWLISGA